MVHSSRMFASARTADVRSRRLEQDIAQLEIAVQDAFLVQERQPRGNVQQAPVHLRL